MYRLIGIIKVSRVSIFQTKNFYLGKFLEGLAMEVVGLFDGDLVYFTNIWYILWLFGIFFPFWYVVPRKIWQPWV
jgi:hypothetical protein